MNKENTSAIPKHSTICENQEPCANTITSPTPSSPVKVPLNACETHRLHENILAAHQRGTMVIGSVDMWTDGNVTEALLSSTPADVLLGESVKPSFGSDVIQPFTDFGNSTDSGLQVHPAKESNCVHQVMVCGLGV